MQITNDAEFEAASARSKELMGKGGRLNELNTRKMIVDDLSPAELDEHDTLLREYSELGVAMRKYEKPILVRTISSLYLPDF